MAKACSLCGNSVNPQTAYRKVTGWEAKREDGGTNALRLRQPHDEWACYECIDSRAKARVPEGQGSLVGG